MGFKERVKEFREKQGMTQEEFAKFINVSQPTVFNYEIGKIKPHINTAIQIARIMNIDVNELLKE